MADGVRRRLISRKLFGLPANVRCGSKTAYSSRRKVAPPRDDTAADAKKALIARMTAAAKSTQPTPEEQEQTL